MPQDSNSNGTPVREDSVRRHERAKKGWKKLKVNVVDGKNQSNVSFMDGSTSKNKQQHRPSMNSGNWLSKTFRKIFDKDGHLLTDSIDTTPMLMEVVSARNLSNKNNLDPYVVVHVNGKEVHRTKSINKDKDPIWTIKHDSMCIVHIPNRCAKPKEQEKEETENEKKQTDGTTNDEDDDDDAHYKMTMEVSVWSGLINQIGSVTLNLGEVLAKDGAREEYPLAVTGKKAIRKGLKPTVALRFREARDSDFDFFSSESDEDDQNTNSNGGNKNNSTPNNGGNKNNSTRGNIAEDINFRNVTQPTVASTPLFNTKHIDGVEHFRVQPGPDPDRPPEETRWMSMEAIHEEALKPSKKWVEAGYGSLGKCYVEIIGCDNLPNMDLGAANDYTDAFVGIVFEDTMVRTDVINDDLNPRWMPWTDRAFAFNIRHPSSLLFLGVFDYDLLTDHDPIGRIVIETDSFESDTSYLLHYNLYQDMQQKEPAGTITIRYRVEWKSEAEAAKMTLVSPPRFLINVETKKTLDVLRYLCRGPINMQVASIESVTLYAEELQSYGDVYFYVIDVICGILLWRGRARFGYNDLVLNFWFPIHSIFIFIMANMIVEQPRYLVPIISCSITWFLVSLNLYNSSLPSPWKRCKPLGEFNRMLVLGHSGHGAIYIEPGQSEKEAVLRDQVDQVKADRMKGLFFEAVYTGLKVRKVYNKTDMEKIDIDTAEKAKGLSLLTNVIYYVHMMLSYLCTYLNMIRNILNWRGYQAHQLTVLSFALTVAWFILPMEFLVRWVLRILIWTLLGPGMKLVDIFLFHPFYSTREELESDPSHDGWELERLLESEALEKMGEAARLAAEEALKLKDMRSYRFGDLSQLIPAADSSRFPSVPLAASSAQPYLGPVQEAAAKDGDDNKTADENDETTKGFRDLPSEQKNWMYVPGQRLEGHMIHRHVKTVNPQVDASDERDDVKQF